MKTFMTDENNDLFLNGKREIELGTNLDAVLQVTENELRTVKGELQLNIKKGIPYFETIFKMQTPDISVWQGYMIESAEKVSGVDKIDSFDVKITNDILHYTMKIRTKYGNGILEV